MTGFVRIATVATLIGAVVAGAPAQEVTVNSTQALRSAISRAKPGMTILIANGDYTGGMHLRNVSGKPDARITIKGANPDEPPMFRGDRMPCT